MTSVRLGPAPTERVSRVRGSELRHWCYATAGAEPLEDAEPPESAEPTVVLVHGLRGTHDGLEPLVWAWRPRRAVVPDLPGFGASSPMTERAHDVDGYAEAIIALIHEVEPNRPVVLVGHSFGSVIAAKVAASAPELVSRLVLVNPIATPALHGPRAVLSKLTSAYYWLGKSAPDRLGRAVLSNKWIVLAASRAMVRTRDPRLRRFVHDSHLRHFSRFHSPALVSATFDASVAHTVTEHAEALRMPTLLIAGETDEIAPLDGQRALADRLAHAELAVLSDVGHLVHYEKPEEAAAAIRAFLSAE